jgi:TolB-like protein/Tfp pilus assembly protein PilF
LVAAAVLVGSVGAFLFLRNRGPAAGSIASDLPSIAVLPFVDMSEAKDQQYFSEGMSEELLNLLAKIPALRVTSRSSAFSFRGRNVSIPEIAKSLNVAHVLEGSVRKSGKKLRVTAQLIDARTDTHLWSETYDRTLDDVFAVQDEISAAVVAKLKVSLLGGMPKVRQTDPRAYDLFLQSNEVVRQSLPDRYERNLALMNQALAIDPNYVAAWTRIAVVHANQASQGIDASKSPEEEFKLAREAANKALAIDPTYVWIYPALAQIAMLADLDFAAAARYLEHALALEPGNAELMNPAAVLVQNLGRLKEAAELREFVIARDPVNAAAHFNLGLTYHYMGRPDDAIAAARRSLTIAPKRVVAHYVIALAMLDKNDPQGALLEIQQEPSVGWREIGLPLVYHALGKKRESDEALASLIATRERDSAFNIASAFAFRGETDRAFEWLDKAFANHDSGISIASFEPLLKNLHSDPRWLPFLRKVGKAPEQLAAIKFDVTIPKI